MSEVTVLKDEIRGKKKNIDVTQNKGRVTVYKCT